MKKTLIALMALTGVAFAETYNYVGNNDWTENEYNWKSDAETCPSENSGGWTDTGSGNKFVIGSGKIAKSGGNMIFANTTLEIQNGGTLNTVAATRFNNTTLEIQNGGAMTVSDAAQFNGTTLEIQKGGTLTATAETKFNNTSINIADGGVFTSTTSGGGIKLKDVTINTNSNVTLHRLTFNSDGNMGNITFNLGNEGKISVTNTYKDTGYTSSITLSAILQDGFLTGSGDIILGERVLVDFGAQVTASYALSTLLGVAQGGELTLKNGGKLTLGDFNASALTAGDVGKYKLVMEGSALKVQYAAYSIPEPTTATLSLLALAGLAARRRRK